MKPLNHSVWSGRIQSVTPPARLVCTLAVVLLLGFPVNVYSVTNVVTSLADSGSGSLRQTISDSLSGDFIAFAVSGTITLTNGELAIAKDVNVIGPGVAMLSISGAGTTRIFGVSSNVTVFVSGLTLCNGRTPDGAAGTVTDNGGASAPGGAIFTAGRLTLMNCVITSNRTGNGGNGCSPPIPPYPAHTPPTSGGSSGHGGAIYNSGTLCVSNCVIANSTTGRGGARAHNDTYWSSSGIAGSGGGIYNLGNLTLINSIVSGNGTGAADWDGASGGGLGNDGNVFGTSCVFSNNATASGLNGGSGGGISSQGFLALTNCTVNENRCGNGGPPTSPDGYPLGGGAGGAGGGIFAADCVLIGCTISGNRAGGGGPGGFSYVPPYSGGPGGPGGNGGGIHLGGMFAFLTNCTIAGNFCGAGGDGGFAMAGIQGDGGNGGHGGGIVGPALTQAVVACTIVANAAGGGGGGFAVGAVGYGGGVYTWDAYGSAGRSGGFLSNLIALNTGNGPDLYGGFHSLGSNLIGLTNGCSGFTAAGDLVGSSAAPLDPEIASLADNGGPTMTMALLPGSPAIEAGPFLGVPATDQRGVARPQGNAADIGAYEFEFTPQIISARFQPPSAFWLKCCGLPNQICALLTSTNLLDWFEVTNLCSGANGLCEFTCPDAGDSNKRFFRTKAVVGP